MFIANIDPLSCMCLNTDKIRCRFSLAETFLFHYMRNSQAVLAIKRLCCLLDENDFAVVR